MNGTVSYVNKPERVGKIQAEDENNIVSYVFSIPQGFIDPSWEPKEGDEVTFTYGPGHIAYNVLLFVEPRDRGGRR